jgi:hypothetical protein
MHFVEINGRRYAQFEGLRHEAQLIHGFTTRPWDVSARTDGQAGERAGRRETAATDLGLDARRLHHCVQVHRTQITVVDENGPARALAETDGAAGMVPGMPLMAFSADCPLVLAYDPLLRVVGVVHASWRCTAAGLTSALIETLRREYGCQPARMRAGVGPGAGPCCYEVQDDVYAAAAGLDGREALFPRRGGRMHFDLWAANQAQLLAAGLPAERVEVAGICTMCSNGLFYSFRREGPGCGHFGLVAGIRA